MLFSSGRSRESGAVSIFSVVFGILIMTVITVSFLRVMISDQRQSVNANLADGARSSALAGVEDAKRALLRYKNQCGEDSSAPGCADLRDSLGANGVVTDCNVSLSGLAGIEDDYIDSEVMVKQNDSDLAIEQAYTCVKVVLDTNDYIGKADAHQMKLIPLKAKGEFNSVTVEWFSSDDVQGSDVSLPAPVGRPTESSPSLLKTGSGTGTWAANTPSLLRLQLMQVGSDFTLTNFDERDSSNANSSTAFLYPVSRGSSPTSLSVFDGLLPVRCQTTVSSGSYACSANIRIPAPIDGDASDRVAYLGLMPYYNATHFKVTLHSGTTASSSVVRFDGVQPEVDSTGRANNLFKRVSSRVDMFGGEVVYPGSAVDTEGNLCKDFSVTNDTYYPGSCTP